MTIQPSKSFQPEPSNPHLPQNKKAPTENYLSRDIYSLNKDEINDAKKHIKNKLETAVLTLSKITNIGPEQTVNWLKPDMQADLNNPKPDELKKRVITLGNTCIEYLNKLETRVQKEFSDSFLELGQEKELESQEKEFKEYIKQLDKQEVSESNKEHMTVDQIKETQIKLCINVNHYSLMIQLMGDDEKYTGNDYPELNGLGGKELRKKMTTSAEVYQNQFEKLEKEKKKTLGDAYGESEQNLHDSFYISVSSLNKLVSSKDDKENSPKTSAPPPPPRERKSYPPADFSRPVIGLSASDYVRTSSNAKINRLLNDLDENIAILAHYKSTNQNKSNQKYIDAKNKLEASIKVLNKNMQGKGDNIVVQYEKLLKEAQDLLK